ncbi:hypothetical protein G3I60_05170 [Streptomyces sp. SID13666]|nr:hypothetical protein [Streptomyces sp. SID13666]
MTNELLREAIEQAGLSYGQVARGVQLVAKETGDSVSTTRAGVLKWVRGAKPGPATAGYVAEVLSRRLGRRVTAAQLALSADGQTSDELGLRLGPDPVETLAMLGRADMERRSFLTGAAYSVAAAALPLGASGEYAQMAKERAGTAGRAEITAVQDMTRVLTEMDERHGGRHGRSAVVSYLTKDVLPLCRVSWRTDELRREMLSAAASLTMLVAWKAYDAGEHGLCQRYYLQAYNLTQEAENGAHSAFVLRGMAHHGLNIGRPEHSLEQAGQALSLADGKVDQATLSLLIVCHARTLAANGQRTDALREADKAREIALRGHDADRLPNWTSLWGPTMATIDAHTAKILSATGDAASAEKFYASSATGRDTTAYRRVNGITTAQLGGAQVQQGHIEQACATWGRSLELMDGVASARTIGQVASMRRSLKPFVGRGVREATELSEKVRTWELQNVHRGAVAS